jgi:hypothetical protein
MRIAFVLGVILAASPSLTAARSASTDPSVGAYRINPASQPALVELVDQPIELLREWTVIGTVDTRGYSAYGVMARYAGDAEVGATPYWRFADDEPFTVTNDFRYIVPPYCTNIPADDGVRTICPVEGAELQISAYSASGPATMTSFRVYLIP